ncbi:hypothetical protein POTOM_035392 [Populus tomentosa]|uniref:Ribosomal protein L34e superfamily protein n=1 Tax=Populus tomentosa TaxID=118781 RepID=A0A8X8CLZ9_POPTO|nr:hypothetical protein POTOM_035392 [Populus tomentosa]
MCSKPSQSLVSRKCHQPGCKGFKKAIEFDLQLQTEDCLKSTAANDVDKLPWKGGTVSNPDYECLRAELRKMAPPNGRAVLLFRSKCGCPVAKLEGWGPKRGRRHKRLRKNLVLVEAFLKQPLALPKLRVTISARKVLLDLKFEAFAWWSLLRVVSCCPVSNVQADPRN